jgi:hypothetical protein
MPNAFLALGIRRTLSASAVADRRVSAPALGAYASALGGGAQLRPRCLWIHQTPLTGQLEPGPLDDRQPDGFPSGSRGSAS